MSDRMLQAAVEEEKLLVQELAQNPTYMKLEAVRALLALYRGEAVGKFEAPRRDSPIPAYGHADRISSKSSQALLVAEQGERVLQNLRRRASVAVFMDEFKRMGVEIVHDKPISYVSSVLSHNSRFNNIRGKGYGLAAWGDGDGPPSDDETPAPPSPIGILNSSSGLKVDPQHGWGAPHISPPDPRAQEAILGNESAEPAQFSDDPDMPEVLK